MTNFTGYQNFIGSYSGSYDGRNARLVISEYLKYVYTVVRIHVVPREPALVARGARTAG